jgi:hypothetical protein
VNLVSLKVTRVDGPGASRCPEDICPFLKGDKSSSLMMSWSAGRNLVASIPPSDPVECSVVGMPPGSERALMNDTLILGVGEDQACGGMDFEVKKPVEAAVRSVLGSGSESSRLLRGGEVFLGQGPLEPGFDLAWTSSRLST